MKVSVARILLRGMLIVSACFLVSCGNGDSEGEGKAVDVAGKWAVTLDFGDGTVGHQTWTITQSGNILSMTGDPGGYGPYLDSEPTNGYAGDTGFWAVYTKTYGVCRYTSNLNVTVTGNTFSGSMYWLRGSHGAGYCSSNRGDITVTGSR